jgi:predicted MFS family arabinose efflux permease
LNATPLQLGILAAAQGLPVLLFAVSAGVWVDRLPLRPVLIVADLLRAAVLLQVPVAAVFGLLRIEQLYIVAFSFGLLEMAFDIAYRSYLPLLVGPEQVIEGNSRLSASDAVAEIGSPAAGGALVQAAGAPVAMVVDALTFLWSAAFFTLIRRKEEARGGGHAVGAMPQEALMGLQAVWGDRILRAITIQSGCGRFFGGFYQALYSLFLIRTLDLSPLAVGITIGAGGIGSLAGAFMVGPLTRRLGVGPTLLLSSLVPIGVLIPLAGEPKELAFAMIFIAQLLGDPFGTIYQITSVSVRQAITPQRLLGRVSACMYVVPAVALPLGALTAGALAEAIGVRETLWVSEAGGLIAATVLVFSPLRRLRELAATSKEETEIKAAGATI